MAQDATYSITLLRHGESLGNVEGRIQGQSDYPLTETGIQQARRLGDFWQAAGVGFDRIIASPLVRARQTAEIIAAALCLPVVLDPVWMERNHGDLEGRTIEQILNEYPQGLDFYRPYQPAGKGGESLVDLYLRASQALQELLRKPTGRYLVVSHGAILNMTLYAVLGLSPQGSSNRPRFRFGNTAFTDLTYDPIQCQWWINSFNGMAHLQNGPMGLSRLAR